MGSTTVNSWITAFGSFITIASIWIAWWLSRRQRSERRIDEVASRYVQLRLAKNPNTRKGPLTTFILAGALGLSQREMVRCAARLVKSGQDDPLHHPRLKEQDILRRALDKRVNLDDWASRTSFLISEALTIDDEQV